LSDVLALLREAFRGEYGLTARRVRIDTYEEADPYVLPIPPAAAARPTPPPATTIGKVGRTVRAILKAVAGMDAEEPTGPEIAAAAKLPYESHLKKTLSTMRAEGFLGGDKGDEGYPITPLGLAMLDPEN
jgi:hypothetical protein